MSDEWDSRDDAGEKDMLSKDWKRVENGLEKHGYRQGLESSQEETMQDGFNQAFNQAVTMALNAGRLQGCICACVSLNSKSLTQDSDNSLAMKTDPLENINNDIDSLMSEIPYILGGKKSCSDKCLCTSQDPELGVDTTPVQTYWSRLGKLQEKAEKEEGHLDSSFVPQV